MRSATGCPARVQELASNRHSEGDRTVSTGRLAATYALDRPLGSTQRVAWFSTGVHVQQIAALYTTDCPCT